ncbi:MAG: hypothetical protein EAZ15_03850 [Sphingobacteriales bacterium]|nr:MAG: hypothetical protein EAZ15_03850 [Sphingobacteriales bacterium]
MHFFKFKFIKNYIITSFSLTPMDFFNHKRHYRFKGGNNGNENKLFWIIGIVLTLVFLLIYYYKK